jgi:carboxylate-amine ligase
MFISKRELAICEQLKPPHPDQSLAREGILLATPVADFSIGVEEEFQIVDAETRALRSRAGKLLPRARARVGDDVTNELYLSQIEVGTIACATLAEVRSELVRLRRAVIEAARRDGCRIAAAGTHPFSHWHDQTLTPKDRYHAIADEFQQVAREQIIFGCHVHIGIADREAAVQVMNRARPWLATLLALSANSPFWLGNETGYASYRTELFGRFPMTGTPQAFSSRAEYDGLVADLVACGAIEDASHIYWDARPSSHVETLEFRVADVCMSVDETVMLAGLTRAVARTCHDQWVRGEAVPPIRPELLRAAKWRASRFGHDGELIDVFDRRAMPAADVVKRLLEFVRPWLEEAGEWHEVATLVKNVSSRGTGARRQREVWTRTGRWEDVVDRIIVETEQGTI